MDSALVQTGISGLDDVLRGGLPQNRIYLVEGDPGSGKTTLGLQFLLEGVRRNEPTMYIALSETKEEIDAVARSHGWSLDKIHLFELTAAQQSLALKDEETLFDPSETQLRELMAVLLAQVEKAQPARIVIDSPSELRLLAQDPLRYRRQILALKQFFAGRKSTVLLLDDRTSSGAGDMQLQSLAHGLISLESHAAEYGKERRRLRMVKIRGVNPRGGYHEFVIRTGGIDVFPRLVAAEHTRLERDQLVSSGVPELDALLGGGLDRGTSTLVLGAAGTGKSSLAARYLASAAQRGENAVLFAFDERLGTLQARTVGLGMPLDPHLESGKLSIRQIDPADMGPSEFAGIVRDAVERQQATMVVIDSLNGYLNAMPEYRLLLAQMHELLGYLSQRAVTSFLVMTQSGLIGPQTESPVDISYLADTVMFLRFFETGGQVRKALSVLKKRSGSHETTIREYRLGAPSGIQLGPALTQFTGILTGSPVFQGGTAELMTAASSDVGSRP
jgi:circadian clock protein KaiC